MSDLFRDLAAPFSPDKVSWRIGSTTGDKARGMALAYIDARDVMERLDAACGPSGWQCRYSHAEGKTICEIGVRVVRDPGGTSLAHGAVAEVAEWIWKADGAGDSDVEAEKGALSDAFKRAAVRWGIGRYLYDVSSPWVAIEAAGRSYKIPDNELARLRKMLSNGAPQTAAAPAVAEPTPSAQPDAPTESEQRTFYRLANEVKALATLSEMNLWRQKPENIEWFRNLPPTLRAKLQHEMTTRRDTLSKLEPAEA